MKAYKTYVITLSRTFPVKHQRAGEPTYFKEKMHNGLLWDKGTNIGYALTPSYAVPGDIQLKLHTIRANYELWRKRFVQIESGEACLSVRQWTGKPYASKQVEIARLTKEDGIGLQRLFFHPDRDGCHVWWNFNIDGGYHIPQMLAEHDGLAFDDWKAWFRDYDLSKPLAIIHFTNFRY